MLVDLLRYTQRRPGSARRVGGLRPAAFFAATVYLLVAAVPAVRLLVHEHAGDDRSHTHSNSPHSHGPGAATVEAHTPAAEHSHRAAAHHAGHGHPDGHDHDDPHHDHDHSHADAHHDHGEVPSASNQPIGDGLRVADGDHRAHWHRESPHGLVVLELPLLLVPIGRSAAGPSFIASARPRDASRPTRARGPPLPANGSRYF